MSALMWFRERAVARVMAWVAAALAALELARLFAAMFPRTATVSP